MRSTSIFVYLFVAGVGGCAGRQPFDDHDMHGASLKISLATSQLRSPLKAAEIMSAHGVDTVANLQLLGPTDWAELRQELKVGGILIGDLAKIAAKVMPLQRAPRDSQNNYSFMSPQAFDILDRRVHKEPVGEDSTLSTWQLQQHVGGPSWPTDFTPDGQVRSRRLQHDSGAVSGGAYTCNVHGVMKDNS